MYKILSVVGVWVISSVFTRIISALGIGFFTYKSISFSIDKLVGYLKQTISGLPSSVLDIMNLMGTFKALSIVLSAVTVAASLSAVKVFVASAKR